MKAYRLLVFMLISFSFVSCSSNKSKDIQDTIPLISLTPGITDSILVSDLFYLPDYNITFEKHPEIDVDYNKQTNMLYLTAKDTFSRAKCITFIYDNKAYDIGIVLHRAYQYTFHFKPDKNHKTINLFGSFNNWDRSSLPMKDDDGDGTYETTLTLDPGMYEYKFYADGEELLDPANPEILPNDIGGQNSIARITEIHDDIYLHQLNYNKQTGEYIFAFENKFRPAQINADDVFAMLGNHQVNPEDIIVEDNNIKIKAGKSTGEQLIRILVTNFGQNSNIQYVHTYKGMPLDNDYKTWYDGVIYSLMIDRFYDGDPSINHPVRNDSLSDKANYMGGDLQGILDKMNQGYFDSLGINILWISPVNKNPDEAYKEYPAPHRYYSGYHGYWPTHHLEVEENFGDMKKLKELVNTAHNHNIKVLLDFVSNHVHEKHPFFRNHPEWFGDLKLPDGRLNLRFWDEYRLTTWFEPYLPSFDYQKSEKALQMMTDNAIWWLKTTGADGFRHDAVKHVPNKFWRELTRKIKKEIAVPKNVYVYQIGETFGDYDLVSSYVNNGQLSSQFNFNLYNSAQAAFIDPGISFDILDHELKKTAEVYGTINYMGNIMDSHDKNRYMAYADGDLTLDQWSAIEEGWNNPPKVDHPESYKKMELYMAYMNAIPGLPVIYYGSEFGMTGASDPDNRRMMRFGNQLSADEKDALNEVSHIVKLRNTYPALRYGDYYNLIADKNIFAFIRSYMDQRILVVINKSEEPQSVDINIPSIYNSSMLTDLVSGDKIIMGNNSSINIDKISWRMLRLE